MLRPQYWLAPSFTCIPVYVAVNFIHTLTMDSFPTRYTLLSDYTRFEAILYRLCLPMIFFFLQSFSSFVFNLFSLDFTFTTTLNHELCRKEIQILCGVSYILKGGKGRTEGNGICVCFSLFFQYLQVHG